MTDDKPKTKVVTFMRRGSSALMGGGGGGGGGGGAPAPAVAPSAGMSSRRSSAAAISAMASSRRPSAVVAQPHADVVSTKPFAAAIADTSNAPEVHEEEEPVVCISVDDMMKRQKSFRPFRAALDLTDDVQLETLDDLAKLAGASNRRQSTMLVAMIQQQLHAANDAKDVDGPSNSAPSSAAATATAAAAAAAKQNRKKSLADHRLPANVEDMDEEQLKTSFNRRRSTVGKDKDATTLKLATKLADLMLTTEDYAEAEKYIRVRLEVVKMDMGLKHPDTLAVTRQLAELQAKQNKYRAANMTLKGTLISHTYMYGDDHQLTLDVKVATAQCLFRSKKMGDAARIYRSVLSSLLRIEEADEHKNGHGYGAEYKYNVYAAYAECLVAQELYIEAETTHVTLIDLSTQVGC